MTMDLNVNARHLDEELTLRFGGYRLYVRVVVADNEPRHLSLEVDPVS